MQLSIPNPFLPVIAPSPCTRPGSGTNWARQQQMRASLFATARELLADEGLNGFSLRELADRAGTSKQSIFTRVGTKNEVLWRAVSDFMQHQLDLASLNSTADWALCLFQSVWDVSTRYPDYMCALVDYLWSQTELLNKITHECAIWLVPNLRSDTTLNVRNGYDYYAIARQLMMMNGSATFEWASGMSSLADFRCRGLSGPAIFIDGLRN